MILSIISIEKFEIVLVSVFSVKRLNRRIEDDRRSRVAELTGNVTATYDNFYELVYSSPVMTRLMSLVPRFSLISTKRFSATNTV